MRVARRLAYAVSSIIFIIVFLVLVATPKGEPKEKPPGVSACASHEGTGRMCIRGGPRMMTQR